MPSRHPVARGLAVSLTVCGAVAALAVTPARADDGPPAVVDPTVIVAATSAAAPAVALDPAAPLDASADAQTPPETTAVLPDLPTIPPAIPPLPAAESTPPAVSADDPSTPAPGPEPAPQAAPPDTPAPAPAAQAGPDTSLPAKPGDTGNTASNNSSDITVVASSSPPQTFIWNWFWNCAADEAVPAAAAPPANATVIVLDWHWDCAEPPPPLDVTGVTVCVSCNVAISVRVASPGNAGDLTQAIAASTAAAATALVHTIEDALQSAPVPAPAPRAPTPVWAPPVSTAPASTAPAPLSQVVSPADEVVSSVDAVLQASVGVAVAENLPRVGFPQIGAPPPLDAARPKVPRRAAGPAPARSRIPAAGRAAALVRVVVIERSIEQHHGLARARPGPAVRKARPAAVSGRGPVPPVPPLPTLPVPVLAGAGLASTQGGGSGAVAALACGLALLFVYAIFTVLRLPPVVPPARGADANPHPPG